MLKTCQCSASKEKWARLRELLPHDHVISDDLLLDKAIRALEAAHKLCRAHMAGDARMETNSLCAMLMQESEVNYPAHKGGGFSHE
jgi:hypothetical protein